MFGIKTKKYKKIKGPQKEIEQLKDDVITICSEYVLPSPTSGVVSKKHIKRVLASKMVEEIDENMEIEHTIDKYRGLAIYRGKLEVVKRSE